MKRLMLGTSEGLFIVDMDEPEAPPKQIMPFEVMGITGKGGLWYFSLRDPDKVVSIKFGEHWGIERTRVVCDSVVNPKALDFLDDDRLAVCDAGRCSLAIFKLGGAERKKESFPSGKPDDPESMPFYFMLERNGFTYLLQRNEQYQDRSHLWIVQRNIGCYRGFNDIAERGNSLAIVSRDGFTEDMIFLHRDQIRAFEAMTWHRHTVLYTVPAAIAEGDEPDIPPSAEFCTMTVDSDSIYVAAWSPGVLRSSMLLSFGLKVPVLHSKRNLPNLGIINCMRCLDTPDFTFTDPYCLVGGGLQDYEQVS